MAVGEAVVHSQVQEVSQFVVLLEVEVLQQVMKMVALGEVFP
jgi:hypothetical protein